MNLIKHNCTSAEKKKKGDSCAELWKWWMIHDEDEEGK